MTVTPLKKILYADDEPDIREVVMLSLVELGGFAVEAYASGRELLTRVTATALPDLVLLDVMMPGLDGPQTLTALRARQDTRDLPVVFITAKAESHEIERLMQLGAIGTITKPFEPENLARELTRIWERYQKTRAPAESVPPMPTTGIADRLAALRAGFIVNLARRQEEIERAAAALTDPSAPPLKIMRAIAMLGALAHKLAGAAGTFGFSELGQVARRLSEHCALTQSGGDLRPDQLGEAIAAVADLRRLAGAASAGAASPVRVEGPASTVAAPTRRNEISVRSIVVVTHDETEAEAITGQLSNFAIAVRHLSDPAALAGALAEAAPTGVILDADAGGRGAGLAAATALRKQGVLRCPVIVLSARDDIVTRLAAAEADCAAFLSKPLDIAHLIDALDRVLLAEEVEPYRVLIIDDDVEVADYAAIVLRGAGMIAEVLIQPLQVLAKLGEFAPELILMDMHMPDCDGRALATTIRQIDAYTPMPIVFLSGESGLDHQLDVLQHGGDGFLSKSLSAGQLASAVAGRVQRFRQLRSLMVRDSLTGLFNHSTLMGRIEPEIGRARRLGGMVSYAMLDIDHFKSVNDTHGHAVGDQVIKTLASLLKQRLRATDIIGRVGGEEFAILMPGAAIADAERVCDRIRGAFAAIRHGGGERTFTVTLSCGLAQYPPLDTAAGLQEAADGALYAAKHGGRNRVVLAEMSTPGADESGG